VKAGLNFLTDYFGDNKTFLKFVSLTETITYQNNGVA
jgi:hypothetical protein